MRRGEDGAGGGRHRSELVRRGEDGAGGEHPGLRRREDGTDGGDPYQRRCEDGAGGELHKIMRNRLFRNAVPC